MEQRKNNRTQYYCLFKPIGNQIITRFYLSILRLPQTTFEPIGDGILGTTTLVVQLLNYKVIVRTAVVMEPRDHPRYVIQKKSKMLNTFDTTQYKMGYSQIKIPRDIDTVFIPSYLYETDPISLKRFLNRQNGSQTN